MIHLEITKTSKSYNPKDEYRIYDHETQEFKTMEDAKKYLKEEYRNSKRKPMYADYEDRTKKIGYVIGFKNDDGRDKWLEQHWISFHTLQPIELNQGSN